MDDESGKPGPYNSPSKPEPKPAHKDKEIVFSSEYDETEYRRIRNTGSSNMPHYNPINHHHHRNPNHTKPRVTTIHTRRVGRPLHQRNISMRARPSHLTRRANMLCLSRYTNPRIQKHNNHTMWSHIPSLVSSVITSQQKLVPNVPRVT
jgi:hypothetical protein